MRFDVDTTASPEQVRRAFTDFSERRAQIWSRTLDPKKYELREQGDTWAVARESTPGSPFWVVTRYDWSDPAVIRWTTAARRILAINPNVPSGTTVGSVWNGVLGTPAVTVRNVDHNGTLAAGRAPRSACSAPARPRPPP